jgi:hypothetical protein
MAGPPRYVSSRNLLSATYRQSITSRGTLPRTMSRIAMPKRETTHLRVLIGNEKRERLELLAQVVTGVGHAGHELQRPQFALDGQSPALPPAAWPAFT